MTKELLVFTGAVCAPCKVYKPILEEFSEQYPDLPITLIDVADEPETAALYRVRSLPTTILIEDKEMVIARTGILSKMELMGVVYG